MMQIMECSKVFVVAFIGLILMTAGFCLTLAACFAPPINDAVKGVRIAGPVILGIGTVVLGTSCLMCSVVQEKCCSHYLEYWKKRRSVMSFFRGELSRGGPDGMTDTIPVTANDVGSPTGTGESAFINYNDINRPPPPQHPHPQHVCGNHGAKCDAAAAAAAAASSAVIAGAPQCMPPSVCPPPYNHQRACYDSPRYDHRASSYSHNIDFSTATEDDDDDDLDDELDFDSLEVSSGGTPIGSPVRAPVRQYSSIPSVRVKSLASRKLLGALDDHETRRLLDSANASNSSTPFSSPQREPRGMPPPPSPSPAPASTSTAADRDECLAVYPHDPPPPPAGLITRGVGQYIILPRGDISSPAASPHKTPPERARTSHHGNRGKSQSPLLPRRTTEHPSYRGSTVKIGHSVV